MRSELTFGSPGAEWAAIINDMVEGEREDEEGAVTGRVHLEGHVPLVQPNCLTLFSQRRLQQLTTYLGYEGYTDFTHTYSILQ